MSPSSKSSMIATEFGLDQVNVSLMEGPDATKDNDSQTQKTIPLIISPRWDDSLSFLCIWLVKNRAWVDEQILVYGAVLLRGFQVDSPVHFERATLALQPNLCDAYRGTSPRTLQPNTKYAFSAADVPVNYPIAQHLEMSFLKSPPRHLYFGCMKASSTPGGETALCDFRKVYQDISPQLRQKLQSKKIKYTRTHYKVGEKYTYDVGAMLGWPMLFGTSDKQKVETIVQQEEAPAIHWTGPNNDTFVQEWIDEPFQRHPVTNEMVWFNHSQVFHWTTFPMELFYAFCRVKDVHLLLHFLVVSIFCFIKYGLLGYKMALNTTFGDGTPITFREMNEIRSAIHRNLVFSRWKKGDILCIDNFSTSHGRQPTYDKGRKVIVAWSHPQDKTSPPDTSRIEMVSTLPMSSNFTKSLSSDEDENPPGAVPISPDSSPENTLTSVEAHQLSESLFTHRLASAIGKASRRRRLQSCPSMLQFDSEFWTNTVASSE